MNTLDEVGKFYFILNLDFVEYDKMAKRFFQNACFYAYTRPTPFQRMR